MKRIIIDTNVYKFILKSIEKQLLEFTLKNQNFVFYGNSVIRKELRDIPRFKIGLLEGKKRNLRNTLLSLYDFIVGKHHYEINRQMEELADNDFKKELGGGKFD